MYSVFFSFAYDVAASMYLDGPWWILHQPILCCSSHSSDPPPSSPPNPFPKICLPFPSFVSLSVFPLVLISPVFCVSLYISPVFCVSLYILWSVTCCRLGNRAGSGARTVAFYRMHTCAGSLSWLSSFSSRCHLQAKQKCFVIFIWTQHTCHPSVLCK